MLLGCIHLGGLGNVISHFGEVENEFGVTGGYSSPCLWCKVPRGRLRWAAVAGCCGELLQPRCCRRLL